MLSCQTIHNAVSTLLHIAAHIAKSCPPALLLQNGGAPHSTTIFPPSVDHVPRLRCSVWACWQQFFVSHIPFHTPISRTSPIQCTNYQTACLWANYQCVPGIGSIACPVLLTTYARYHAGHGMCTKWSTTMSICGTGRAVPVVLRMCTSHTLWAPARFRACVCACVENTIFLFFSDLACRTAGTHRHVLQPLANPSQVDDGVLTQHVISHQASVHERPHWPVNVAIDVLPVEHHGA